MTTPARIALGRTGVSQPTHATLTFALDHARARDAVHAPLDIEALARRIGPCVVVRSAAPDRSTYLARPDLGARLSQPLEALPPANPDLVIVLADGLSSRALTHAPDLLAHLLPALDGLRLAPLIIATQARVALADEIGQSLDAAMALILIGERPGLSVPDSLGAYLTWAPRVGRTNAERNCVSNIRPAGLAPADAAQTLAWLIHQARRLRLTGISLKDESRLKTIPEEPSSPPGGSTGEAGDGGVRDGRGALLSGPRPASTPPSRPSAVLLPKGEDGTYPSQ